MILDILQDAALELGITVPISGVNSTDLQTKQLVALLTREGKEARCQVYWPQLTKEWTFSLVDSQANYALPGDFERFDFRTMWSRGNHWELTGPLSPQEWQWRKSGIVSSGPRQRFRIKGSADNQFYIDPTPGSSDASLLLVYEYQSANWVRPKTWVTATNFVASSYCFYNGNFYFTASGGTTGATAPTHTSGTASDGGVSWAYYSDAYDKPLADTDVSLIAEDIITMGLKWRFMQQKGLDYVDLKRQYDEKIRAESTSLTGARTLNLTGPADTFLISPFNIPDTGYGA